jgi:hypothetical protein
VIDAQGNELKVGDLIHCKVGNEWVIGTITRMQAGGLAVTGMPKNRNDNVGVTPPVICLEVGIAFQQPPGTPIQGVLKLSRDAAVQSSLTM